MISYSVMQTFSINVLTMMSRFNWMCLLWQKTAVGGATITTPNVAATNGLIHIIDKVHS